MFEFCADPDTLGTLPWLRCYLTTGVHMSFYWSFLTVLALLAITAPVALASAFSGAMAARSRLLPLRLAGQGLYRHGARRARHRVLSCSS
jgi:polar amino acid transport system permease protein